MTETFDSECIMSIFTIKAHFINIEKKETNTKLVRIHWCFAIKMRKIGSLVNIEQSIFNKTWVGEFSNEHIIHLMSSIKIVTISDQTVTYYDTKVAHFQVENK